MSLLFRSGAFPTAAQLVAERIAGRAGVRTVSADEAMRHSGVWAALRLRANLVSTSPVDVYRNVSGRAVEVPIPPVLVNPGGSKVDIREWLYSSQMDLDRFGNSFGLITAMDGNGFPARIDLQSAESASVRTVNGTIAEFKFGTKSYDPAVVWHEKQYTVSGVPVGLSPLAAAAMTLRTYLSAQEFAREWFAGGSVPVGQLKNTAKKLDPDESRKVKERFKTSVSTGDVFVTGADWEYTMLGAKASEAAFIEERKLSMVDVARYFDVPADLIDAGVSGESVTYANITQRNLQMLIMSLGPTVTRREGALSRLLPQPRFMKLNTDAVVLRMDPRSRAELNQIFLESRQRAPSEVREKDDLPPFTPEQIAEINALTPVPKPPATIKN